MAGTTITGSVAGLQVAVNATGDLQQALASQVLTSASPLSSMVFKTASGTLTGKTAIVSGSNSLVSGATSVPSATVLLNGQGDLFVNSYTMLSTVIAADNTNSTILSTNAHGALLAVTGAGANLLMGLANANAFTTGVGGQDIVYLSGTKNTLTSNGTDGVLVGGPSTVTAAAGGMDDITLLKGASLSFVNGSATAVDSITGAANTTVAVAGMGHTSVTAGAGPESFVVDTAAGNVTLNAGLQADDVFSFVKDTATGSNRTLVVNFAAGDQVLLHGYTGYNVTTLTGTQSGSLLALSDGSQVTFNNVSSTTLLAALKPS